MLRWRFAQVWPWLAAAAWLAVAFAIWQVSRGRDWSAAATVAAVLGWGLAAAVAFRHAARDLFGPVFAYEVTRLGRKRFTFFARFLYACLLALVLLISYAQWTLEARYDRAGGGDTLPAAQLSRFAYSFFAVYAILQCIVVAFLTPAYVAGCIADEKERKTLEFLLATDLKSHEIIFGKLAARVMTLLAYVLVGLPVISLLQLFGGIDVDLLVVATGFSVVTILGFAAVSVYYSTVFKRPRDAVAVSFVALVGYLVLTFALSFGMFALSRTVGAATYTVLGVTVSTADLMLWGNYAVDAVTAGNLAWEVLRVFALSGGTLTGVDQVLAGVLARYALFWLAVGGGALLYSFLRLRPVALAQAAGPPAKSTRKSRRRMRNAERRPAVGDDPMFWKEVHVEANVQVSGCFGSLLTMFFAFLLGTPLVLIAGACFGDLWPWLADALDLYRSNNTLGTRVEDFQEGVSVWARVCTGVITAIAILAVAVRAASTVSSERDRDTWVSLASTPLSAWEIVRGKWWGAMLGVRAAYRLLLGVWVVALVAGAVEPVMVAVCAAHVFVYLAAFAWLGVFFSIHARTTLIATVRTMLATLFLMGGHWIFQLLCCTGCMALTSGSPSSSREIGQLYFESLGALTPPWMAGWFLLRDFGDLKYEVYLEERSKLTAYGLPVASLVWVGANFVLIEVCWRGFRRISNRTRSETASDYAGMPTSEARGRLG